VRGVAVVDNHGTDEIEITKTFKYLVKEVHEPGLCGLCGGCVSFCSADDLEAIGFGDDGKPHMINEENCLECGICYLICPQIDILDDEIKETFHWKKTMGSFRSCLSARSTDPEILKVCTDGGVVSSIIKCLIEKKMIEGAAVSKRTSQFKREPLIAQTYDDILSAAGTDFAKSKGDDQLGRFSTYSPTMFAVRDVKNMDLLRIAVVGTPCQVHTLRKMQSLSVVPSHVVKYVLGLFCTENFSFSGSKKELFEEVLGVKLEDIVKMNLKEDLIIWRKDGSSLHIPLEKLNEFTRAACLACSDFANDFADLSFGGLGSPNGWTTVVIRTETGEAIFHEALSQGYIEVLDPSKERTEGTSSSDIVKKITDFAKMKEDRANKNCSTVEQNK
jgi:coenzyme F420 hydrogenase subunit beta